ncbi:MAG: lytic transglycosylase [Flavobacteriales bacterium]|nr:MAG: lytic transglycosylase [Flavobacteriales bacterium]PIE49812.1 MAG: lytic transglycosylase [Flavobacteriales bacterium]
MIRTICSWLFFFALIVAYAQEKQTSKDIENNKIKTLEIATDSKSDSIHNGNINLQDHKEATLIDSLWLSNVYNSPLYDDFQYVDPDEEITDTVYSELPTELLKERLAHLNSKTPFHVEYNPSLERLIKHYLKTRSKTLGNIMTKSAYYFPLFEEYLDKYDLPLEIKYLAIVESALRPRARSRVGATGLWQFMYYTGKQYRLDVNSYVDDRYEPLRATEAACKFLSNLYTIFGDWDLALAAYNSGPGNVSKAIRRSGGKRNYWNIRHNLPRETAGYLPAFYATYYLFEYAEEHGLKPTENILRRFETDTVVVKRQISFEQINKVLNTNDELLEFLNPQYKLNIIPYIKDKKYTLRLPKDIIGKFTSNEKAIYAYAEADDAKREKQLPALTTSPERIRYRVRKGDYLGRIAKRYGVSVSKLKRWNGLRTNRLRIGQRLTIYPRNYRGNTIAKTAKKRTASRPKGEYTTYVVRKGDSLWLISQKYPKVSIQEIKKWNNIWSVKSLKPGTKLKIYKG